jgi:hypothetical protein
MAQKIEGVVIMTPDTYKDQLLMRLYSLVVRHPNKTWTLLHDDIENMSSFTQNQFSDRVCAIACYSRTPTDLEILFKSRDNGEEYTRLTSSMFIEQIWSIYCGCEPIFKMTYNIDPTELTSESKN